MLMTLLGGKHRKAKQKFDNVVGAALQNGMQGRVEKAISLVEEAQRLSNQYGFGFNQTEADFIKNTAYKNGLEADLMSARVWANDGDVDTAMKYIDRARQHASVVRVKRDEEIAAITIQAYIKGVEKELYSASLNLQGKYTIPLDALRYIKRARLYASRAGLDIRERAQQLRREAAVKGVEFYLRLSREDAEKGYLIEAKKILRRARRFAQLSGVDISQQIHEIEPVAYANRARLDGVVAKTYRKDGYYNRATLWEEMAKQNAATAETAQKRVNGSVATIDKAIIY